MTIGLGIDTGGTYTDSVILDMDSGRILSRAKDLTTRNDLVIGITGSIGKHRPELLKKISLVSLSSTLATNSVVEGKGCRAGLISIGRRYDGTVTADVYAQVAGSHDLKGNEKVPLDEEAAKAALSEMKGKVDAIAITGYLSIRNPEHEERLAHLADEILGIPVVQGHELSSGLGFNERTTTALMNARLIPVITDLIESVKKSLAKFGIDAPLMIVKGDGTVLNEASAVKRPVETVLSGPASSLTGAKALTGLKDAVMIDIGGTTTDIGVIRNGFPRLEKEGALIGGKRTRVLAAAVSTYGIGGDSRIIVNGTRIELTPVRVIPLCIAATKWPHVREKLQDLAHRVPGHAAETVTADEILQETEFFTPAKSVTTETMQECDRRLLELIAEEPKTLEEAGDAIGVLPYTFNVSRLEKLGLVTRIGVTPSDILHAEESYVEYDYKASKQAVDYLARKTLLGFDEFVSTVKDMIETKIATCLMKDLLLEDGGFEDLGPAAEDLIRKAVSGKDGLDFGVSIRINKPIIGIGAPVGAWLPRIAEIFHTQLLLPVDSNVGNAIGAISGSVSKTVTVHIQPKEGAIGADPASIVFLGDEKYEFPTFVEAVGFAKDKGSEYAERLAVESGATNVVIEVDVEKKTFGTASDASVQILLEADVTIRATGKPDLVSYRFQNA